MDAKNFNVLQNNGRLAHQEVDHVGSQFPFAKLTLFFFVVEVMDFGWNTDPVWRYRCIFTWYVPKRTEARMAGSGR